MENKQELITCLKYEEIARKISEIRSYLDVLDDTMIYIMENHEELTIDEVEEILEQQAVNFVKRVRK